MLCSESEVINYLESLRIPDSYEITNEILRQLPRSVDDFSDLNDILCNILTSAGHRKSEYDAIAVRLLMDHHYSRTPELFSDAMMKIQENRDVLCHPKPLLDPEFYHFILTHKDHIDAIFMESVKRTTHFVFTSFGWKTLLRNYLLKTHEGIIERPDHLWFRIALFLHRDAWDRVQTCFEQLREGYCIHATPTLFHAGLKRSQMASCFLVGTHDSVHGIFKTISDVAQISKWAGGIGVHISNIRSKNSYIHGTNGISNGIMPMLKVYNDTSRYIDQCFDGSVRVLCERGFVPIAEISTTDRVLTANGTFERVLLKNQFRNDEDMVLLRTRMNEQERSVFVTSQHEFLVQDGFEALDALRMNARLVFKTPCPDPVIQERYSLADCCALGYIYRHAVVTGECFRVPDHAGHHDALVRFFAQYFRDGHRLIGDGFIVQFPTRSIVPEKLDMFFIGKQDFPPEILRLSRAQLQEFERGWETRRNGTPREMALDYILHADQWNATQEIVHMERRPKMRAVVYDLVVENFPSYQTEVGMVHNGGGKRSGAFAMYIEPWHADIFDFVSAKRNIGSDEERARDLFYGLWIPDLFMEQVSIPDGDWYLMSPSQAPELCNLWGADFESAYWRHVKNNNYVRKIKARELWIEILRSQIESGTPYMLYKDAANRKSNQQHLGTIKSSNLCCEIIEYSDENEYAVCNLASIALPRFVKDPVVNFRSVVVYTKPGCYFCAILKHILSTRRIDFEERHDGIPEVFAHHTTYPLVIVDDAYVGGFTEMWDAFLCPLFDFEAFEKTVTLLVDNLNQVIDRNCYPLEECKRSNLRHRPIGIGVQGLADVFYKMRLPYDSIGARDLNQKIFEALYYYALKASNAAARVAGPYESFPGSPLSKGLFHFDLCERFDPRAYSHNDFDWETLRKNIVAYGTRNSLLIAPMPTASTSQILGNTESFEPLTNNLYVRRTLAGEFYVCNEHLRSDLEVLGKWTNDTIEHLILHKGSIQQLQVPHVMKHLYRTVWEIPQKSLIDMAAERQYFIDQSQSFNIYLNEPNMEKLTKIHFYGWKKGLKTGSYYIRSRSVISSQNVTIDPVREKEILLSGACESCSA